MSLLSNQRGGVVAEFALVGPLLLAILFATIVYGIAADRKTAVTNAAREGGRELAVTGSAEAARARVVDSLARARVPFHHNGDVLFDPAQDVSVSVGGGMGTVTVRYRQPRYVEGLPRLLGGAPWPRHFLFEATSVFRLEQ